MSNTFLGISITIQGIGNGSALEDVEKLWGKPYNMDDVFVYYLSTTGTEFVAVKYDEETKKVESFEIILNYNERA